MDLVFRDLQRGVGSRRGKAHAGYRRGSVGKVRFALRGLHLGRCRSLTRQFLTGALAGFEGGEGGEGGGEVDTSAWEPGCWNY